MRGNISRFLAPCAVAGLLLACGGSQEGAESPREKPPVVGPAGPPAPRPGAAPAWLPAYNAQQLAIINAPTSAPVSHPAQRVYPRLDRFTYTVAQPFDPARAETAARLVAEQVKSSPRLYVVGSVPIALANRIAQYGPPAPDEPDPWVRAQRQTDAGYELAWASPPKALESRIDQANRALAARDLTNAAALFQEVAQQASTVPALWNTLAEIRASLGDDAGAEQAVRQALQIDPRSAEAYRILAQIQLRQGQRAEGLESIARALALYPTSPRAWQTAATFGPLRARPTAPAAFLEVGNTGAIQVGAVGPGARRSYATCRAALRYEPEFRQRMLGLGVDYQLSVGEEVMCLEALLGAYLGGNIVPPPAPTPPAPPPPPSSSAAPSAALTAPAAPAAPPPPPTPPPGADAELDQLMRIAETGLLTGYALFEIIGPHRPEWLRVAPDDLAPSVVEYVRRWVLPTQ